MSLGKINGMHPLKWFDRWQYDSETVRSLYASLEGGNFAKYTERGNFAKYTNS